MQMLPTTMGTRPRLAVELRPEGAVAASAMDGTAILNAVARASMPAGTLIPGLRAQNLIDPAQAAEAVQRVLEDVTRQQQRRDARRDITLIVPDTSVRVLLLDFDELPGKVAEAMPIVRFRLKKLLPFDAEEARISYQILSSTRGAVQVLAVAMPLDVLHEYETLVMGTGYLAGAVLPSSLAAIAGMPISDEPCLIVNVCSSALTAAIVRGGSLLLHRTVEIGGDILYEGLSAWNQEERRLGVTMQATVSRGIDLAKGEVMTSAYHGDHSPAFTEIAQAVSVAAAYFEDSLQRTPEVILSAGTVSASGLADILNLGGLDSLQVRELVSITSITANATSADVPRGWLAGVQGAMKS